MYVYNLLEKELEWISLLTWFIAHYMIKNTWLSEVLMCALGSLLWESFQWQWQRRGRCNNPILLDRSPSVLLERNSYTCANSFEPCMGHIGVFLGLWLCLKWAIALLIQITNEGVPKKRNKKWSNIAGLSTFKSGLKGSKRVLNGKPRWFRQYGTLFGPSGHFWTISDKNQFVAHKDQVGFGRGAFMEKNNV